MMTVYRDAKRMEKTVSCVLLGDSYVGKTGIATSFCDSRVEADYQETVFDNSSDGVSYFGENYRVNIYDVSGKHEHEEIRAFCYSNSRVYVVAYSVTDRLSFNNVRSFWLPEATRYCRREKCSILLVACKSDARHSGGAGDEAAMVSTDEGERLAEEFGVCGFVETSSLERTGLGDLFQMVIGSSLRRKRSKNKFRNIIRRLACISHT